MPLLSVIILSYAVDDGVYQMNCNALDSLYDSEDWWQGELEVLLIESCKTSNYHYLHEGMRIIVPDGVFNFHRYFNIGLENSSGEFLAFCNNDILFEKGWFSAIIKVKREHPRFKCFSPLDDKYPNMTESMLPRKKAYLRHGVSFGNEMFLRPLDVLMKLLISMRPMPMKLIHYVILPFLVWSLPAQL